jgi:quinolinate synthase
VTTEAICRLPAPESAQEWARLRERGWEARQALAERVVVLGHHYQKDEVIEFADVTGDSFLLARRGAAADAELILFLGVYFMAESADILAQEHQTVVLPDLGAGCHLAECADIYTVRDAWTQMTDAVPGKTVIPITYMNSDAALKAFVGEHGGLVCTSSNAEQAFRWAFENGDAVFFFPDEHLGRNTGERLGIPPDEPLVWDAMKADLGGVDAVALAGARSILWKGFCNVHTAFNTRQIMRAREDHPDVRVIVHPECPRPVVAAADEDGSTEYIIRRCNELPSGSTVAIGTDWNLVNRLRQQHTDKTIFCLNEHICPCVTMNRIDLPALVGTLEALADGELPNVVSVDEETATWAKVALDRMLALA